MKKYIVVVNCKNAAFADMLKNDIKLEFGKTLIAIVKFK
jgi:hypothetical protein